VLRTIPSDFIGISYEMSSIYYGSSPFYSSNTVLANLFQTLNIKVLRIGANTVENSKYTDTLRTSGTPVGRVTSDDLDNIFAFAATTGSKVMLGLNFDSTSLAALKGEESLGAKEIAYVTSKYASHLLSFELGNEPDLYYKNGDRPSNYTYTDFLAEFNAFYDTIQQKVPNPPISGPTSANSQTTWTIPFATAEQGKINLLTQHYYVAGANTASVPNQIITLLSPSKYQTVSSYAQELSAAAASVHIPFRMSETNSFYNGGQWGVSNALASSLWSLDYMYNLLTNSCDGVNFHNTSTGPYSLINEISNVFYARPIYYGVLAFNYGSKGNLVASASTTNGLNFNAYSVLGNDQKLYVTLVNKDTLQNASVTINSGNSAFNTASYILLSGPGASATTNVSFGGSQVDNNGNWSPSSIVGLNVVSGATTVTLPAASAIVLTFSTNTITGINTETLSNEVLLVYPNPASPSFIVKNRDASLISITDERGITVKEWQAPSNDERQISDLKSGIYIIRSSAGQNTAVKKVIVK
jgi:hypothetical protein